MLKIAPRQPEINPRATQGPEIGADVEIPSDFDPATFPIIAQHWFGISPAGVGVDTVATAA